MKSMIIKIEVVGNKILFSNSYINKELRGKLRYKETIYPIQISSCSNPQLSIDISERGKINLVEVFLRGDDAKRDNIVSDNELKTEAMVSEVVGWVLMSSAKYDMSFGSGEEKESTLVMNGTVFKMDTSKQLDMAKYLLGGLL